MSTDKSYVGSFMANGVHYQHHLFFREDDRVECTNEFGDVILTFTADCGAYDVNKKSIGHWSMSSGYMWKFTNNDGKQFYYGSDIMEAEVEVAKLYVKGELI